MSEAKPLSSVTRRALLAMAVGGATIAVATARPGSRMNSIANSFQRAFRSPYFSLSRGNYAAWQAQLGEWLQVAGGPAIQIARVEAFAPFGPAARDTIRDRAFLVQFQLGAGASLPDDMIYSVSHPRHGQFDLYLERAVGMPGRAQAMFN